MNVGGAETALVHRSERSVLDGPGRVELLPFAVNGRERLATCSGVSWFRGYHLAVANLYGNHVRIYRFDPDRAELELLHELRKGIAFPEDVAASPDGRQLAVTHSLAESARLSRHRLDESLRPEDGGETLRPGRTFHGVRFSPDGQYLAVTDIGAGSLEVLRTGFWDTSCRLVFEGPLRPKCAAFSPDGQLLAVAWAPLAVQRGHQADGPARGAVSLHRFDAASGAVGEALSRFEGPLLVPEMCTFLPGPGSRILVADQAADVVVAVELYGGALRFGGVFAEGLSFPHGIDASADGRFVAVTSYGDDTLRVCRIVR